MAQYLFPPAVPAALRVVGETALFPVRRVACGVLITVPKLESTRHAIAATPSTQGVVESSTHTGLLRRPQLPCPLAGDDRAAGGAAQNYR